MVKLMYHHFSERSGGEPPLIADDAYEMISKLHDLLPFMELSSCNFLVESQHLLLACGDDKLCS
ncbi:hypothetical protein MUK42_37056 [Musa troglodytarum]|uniref:Uncharacterized protein n=1 Tax=Musa troglodytarum TaxID=320322 RepID=A0A9E7HNM3_9LILI|nr:hypothetical protein MUK42_37056 [Musa troglodytarum]